MGVKPMLIKRTIIDINIMKHTIEQNIDDKSVKDFIVNSMGGNDVFSEFVEDDFIDFKMIQNANNAEATMRIIISSSNDDFKRHLNRHFLEIEDLVSNYNDNVQLFRSVLSSNTTVTVTRIPDPSLVVGIANITVDEPRQINMDNSITCSIYRDITTNDFVKVEFKIELSNNDSLPENKRKQKSLISYIEWYLSEVE